MACSPRGTISPLAPLSIRYCRAQAYCCNPVSDDPNAKIFFISDPSHLIKKFCNHFEKSAAGATARDMLVPQHLVQLVLRRYPPPAPYTLDALEVGETVGEEWYARVVGRLYDLMASSRQPIYRGYRGDVDTRERVAELIDILRIFREWYTYNEAADRGDESISSKQRHSHFLSHQLYFDLQHMIEGFLGLLLYRGERHGPEEGSVCARNISQDSLESLFGRLRAACGGGRDPNVLKVLQAIPVEEARTDDRHEALSRRAAERTNSGMSGSSARVVPPRAPGAARPEWIDHHAVRLPDDFDAQCERARAAATFKTCVPVRWATLWRVQVADEAQQRVGGRKRMHWLVTSKHINKTGLSRMKVGLATAVLSVKTADVLQLLRKEKARQP